jgi:hypothetical protein
MWGSNALRSTISPHGQRKSSALAGNLAIPFKGLRWLHRPGSTTNDDGHPSERLRRQTVAFNGHHKTMDHIPVLNCRMQDVEEGGIGSLLAFFSYTACPTMHGISFTQSIAFRVLRTRAFLLSPRRHQWTLRVNLSVLSWYRASSRL